jgi:hypothetical protein
MLQPSAERPSFWSFTLSFREHWFAAMSGGASVPFTALAVFLDNALTQSVFGLCALTCVWFAAYRVWKPERDRVCDLEARLTPNIKMNDGCVREYPTVREMPPPVPPQEGPCSKWVQVGITPITDAPLIDCEALLTSVDRIGQNGKLQTIETEPIFCPWSNVGGTRTIIRPGVVQWANLFSAYEDSAQLKLEVSPPKLNLAKEIQKPGKYRLCIRITARDTPTQSRSYLFEWDGSFRHITLTPEN